MLISPAGGLLQVEPFRMDMTYWKLYAESAFANGDPTAILTLLFLFLARMSPIIVQSPFFGSKILPGPVKMTFAISLFALFFPHFLTVTKTPLGFGTHAVILCVKELFIGYLLGLIISMPFTIVQSTGMLIDHQRGGASLMVNDPTIQNQSSPLGTLFNFILIVLFFMIGGPFSFIEAIMQSYEVIPPDQFINPHFFLNTSAFWQIALTFFNTVMKLSLQLAAPALIAILMTDVFLGIANRLATQVQITFLGMPLKSLLALLVIFIGWNILTNQMTKEAMLWLRKMERIVLMLKNPEITPSE